MIRFRFQSKGLLGPIAFLVVFVGVIYFICFKLLGTDMRAPGFFVVAFLGVATVMMVMACRSGAATVARRRDAAEPQAWKWGGTAFGVILMLPIYLQALLG